MLVSKHRLNLGKFLREDRNREYANYLLFENDKTVLTNGYWLVNYPALKDGVSLP